MGIREWAARFWANRQGVAVRQKRRTIIQGDRKVPPSSDSVVFREISRIPGPIRVLRPGLEEISVMNLLQAILVGILQIWGKAVKYKVKNLK